MISLDACMAVIGLHNQGYALKAGEGNQVMIQPAVTEAQAAQIMAIRRGMKEARRAIQHLPQLCVVIMPGVLKEYAADLFSAMQEYEHVQIIAIRYHRGTGETEWAYVPMDEIAHRTIQELLDYGWGVIRIECEKEGQCRGAGTGPAAV